MIFFRDKFCPSLVVLDDTRYPLVLYGCILERGMRSWKMHEMGIGMGLISSLLYGVVGEAARSATRVVVTFLTSETVLSAY